MKKILKEMMTPPWQKKIPPSPRELPITEENVRPFINRYWGFFGLDHGTPGKEALIKFCLEFGQDRKEYTIKSLEPIAWAFINGFDNGYESGYKKGWQEWEKWAEENKLMVQDANQECKKIIAEGQALLEEAKQLNETVEEEYKKAMAILKETMKDYEKCDMKMD